MYISCDSCRYDSGDSTTLDDLVHKVNVDGGFMERKFTPEGCSDGWTILCPNDCGGQYVNFVWEI